VLELLLEDEALDDELDEEKLEEDELDELKEELLLEVLLVSDDELPEEDELSLLELDVDEEENEEEEPKLMSHEAKTIMPSKARLNLYFFCIKNALSYKRLKKSA